MAFSSMKYTQLMCSLPYLPPLFAEKQPPLSRLKLEERLKLLEPDDAETLARIESFTHWDRVPIDWTDDYIVNQIEETIQDLKGTLKDVLIFRIELRTVVAALRRRILSTSPPKTEQKWGYGRWVSHIENHWQEPGFRLERIFPWVTEANRLLEQKDSLGLERLFFSLVWNYINRRSEGHYFDFEAVVLYVMRWNIVDRWTSYNGTAAFRRFQDMVQTSLGRYKLIYDEGLS